MKISIIIPFYKGEKYIQSLGDMICKNIAILDGCNQVEVILVNDSPEHTIDLSGWPKNIDTKIIVNEHNEGSHRSRIRGLDIADGEYILFLDQDDLISDDCLKSQLDRIGEYDFVISNGYKMLSDGNKIPLYATEIRQECCLDLKYHYACSNPIVSPGQVLIKKAVIPKQWKEHVFLKNGADDHFLWLLLLETGKKGTLNSAMLYTHVETGINTSLNVDGMAASNLELVRAMEGIAAKSNLKKIVRRSLYYKNNPHRILTKIRFFDVGLRRLYYRVKYEQSLKGRNLC